MPKNFDVSEVSAKPETPRGHRTFVAVRRLPGNRADRVELTIDDRNALMHLLWTRTLHAGAIALQLHHLEGDRTALPADPAAALDPAATILDRDRPLLRRRFIVATADEAIFQGK